MKLVMGKELSILPEKILVVDDEIEIADLVELYLTNENYEVYKFYTAADALSCIGSTELDLAILDVMLPGTSGFAKRYGNSTTTRSLC